MTMSHCDDDDDRRLEWHVSSLFSSDVFCIFFSWRIFFMMSSSNDYDDNDNDDEDENDETDEDEAEEEEEPEGAA